MYAKVQTMASLQKFVTSAITLNIKQIYFSGRDLRLLHSFFSKLLKLLKMTMCCACSFIQQCIVIYKPCCKQDSLLIYLIPSMFILLELTQYIIIIIEDW